MFDRLPPVPIDDPVIRFPRQPVESSSVSHVGYDPDMRTLYLTYRKTGLTYVYYDFSEADYEALMAAGSLGTHVNKVVKPNFYCLPER